MKSCTKVMDRKGRSADFGRGGGTADLADLPNCNLGRHRGGQPPTGTPPIFFFPPLVGQHVATRDIIWRWTKGSLDLLPWGY